MWSWGAQAANILRPNPFDNGVSFDREYQCFSASFMARDDMEKGNKILLPHSALHQLARLKISWPMLFEIKNVQKDRMTHGGVLEFISEEGCCHLPYWMMQNLLLKEGDLVRIRNISLPKGKYVKLQPINKEFAEISNPKAVLENALRNYATLTVGDNIVIKYLDKSYEIEVVELKPAPAITIIETDMEVEFQYSADFYNDQEKKQPESEPEDKGSDKAESSHTLAPPVTPLFHGTANRLDGKVFHTNSSPPQDTASAKAAVEADIAEPWNLRVPGGVRQNCNAYNKLLREGKIPGVVGKARGGASTHEETSTDENFVLYGGKGHLSTNL